MTEDSAGSRAGAAWHWLRRPPLLEARAAVERLQLARDPVFRGEDLPRGDGQPVLLIPGFLAGDWSLSVMSGWLRRMGYRPFGSGLRINQYASEATVAMLTRKLHAAHAACAEPVTMIGHSRGGLLAVVLARRRSALVRQVITLGSPIGNPWAVSPLAQVAVRAIRRGHGLPVRGAFADDPRFERDLAATVAVPTTSIYSRSDAVVDWHACVRPDVESIAVPGSHVGLATNRAAYRIIAGILPVSTEHVAESR